MRPFVRRLLPSGGFFLDVLQSVRLAWSGETVGLPVRRHVRTCGTSSTNVRRTASQGVSVPWALCAVGTPAYRQSFATTVSAEATATPTTSPSTAITTTSRGHAAMSLPSTCPEILSLTFKCWASTWSVLRNLERPALRDWPSVIETTTSGSPKVSGLSLTIMSCKTETTRGTKRGSTSAGFLVAAPSCMSPRSAWWSAILS
uniref:Putative secreted protein n=1 Tax=Ixodes scapularis TaxID=6945 RepID=A0A4D5RAC2_IXOSC